MAQQAHDSGGSEPDPPTVSLTLLTWNVNKSFPRGVSQEGSAKRRDTLIPLVLEHLCKQGKRPHVVLIQESKIQERTARTRWGLSRNYQQQEERKGLYVRQGIDTLLADWDLRDHSLLDLLVPEGATDDEDALEQADKRAGFPPELIVHDSKDRRLMRSDIPTRAFARKLKVTLNEPIIVVSFHSIYKHTNKARYHYIELFFNLMCRLAEVHQCPVLIGGDFNLHVGDWRSDFEKGFGRRVHVAEEYTHTSRRDNIIDTFAVVCPLGARVTCTLSKPVAVYPFPDRVRDGSDHFEVAEFSDSNKEKIKGLGILRHDLDHDPVYTIATLQFRSCVQFGHHDPMLLTPLQFGYCGPMLFTAARCLEWDNCPPTLHEDDLYPTTVRLLSYPMLHRDIALQFDNFDLGDISHHSSMISILEISQHSYRGPMMLFTAARLLHCHPMFCGDPTTGRLLSYPTTGRLLSYPMLRRYITPQINDFLTLFRPTPLQFESSSDESSSDETSSDESSSDETSFDESSSDETSSDETSSDESSSDESSSDESSSDETSFDESSSDETSSDES